MEALYMLLNTGPPQPGPVAVSCQIGGQDKQRGIGDSTLAIVSQGTHDASWGIGRGVSELVHTLHV